VSLLGVTLVCASLGACGFKMRGESITSGRLGEVFILNRGSNIGSELWYYLDDAGVPRAPSAAAADVVIELGNESFERSVLTVDPQTGRAREYELTYVVTYSARDSGGAALLEPQVLTVTRDYVFDPNAVIGSSREEGVLQEEMRLDAVQRILSRLDRSLGG
jgi:LPS-assembly lipoprotein